MPKIHSISPVNLTLNGYRFSVPPCNQCKEETGGGMQFTVLLNKNKRIEIQEKGNPK